MCQLQECVDKVDCQIWYANAYSYNNYLIKERIAAHMSVWYYW